MSTNKKFNASTQNYDAYIETMRMQGIDQYHANMYPQAKEAYEKDQRDEYQRVINADSKSFYNWQDGQKLNHFRTVQEMNDVIASREYHDSKSMREAVQRMAENSPCMFEPNEPGPDLLAESTRADALRATYKQLVAGCASDPVKRLQLVDFLSNPDPAVQNLISEGTRSIDQGQSHNGEQVRHVGSDLGHAMSNPGESSTPVQRDEQKAAKVQGWESLKIEARNAGIDVGPEGGR